MSSRYTPDDAPGDRARHPDGTPARDRDRDFDFAAQACHADALAALSPQTLSRLRAARHAASIGAPARKRWSWLLAGGSAAVLVLAVSMQWQRAPSDSAPPQFAMTTPASGATDRDDGFDSLIAALDENPDLYLWLAANDDALPPPMETRR